MPETDLIWMSLVVFLPTVFALGLLFFPKGWEEAMRWWSLFGTALTLGISICAFILYKNDLIDSRADANDVRRMGSLVNRVEAVEACGTAAPAESQDWLARYDWIKRFNIE